MYNCSQQLTMTPSTAAATLSTRSCPTSTSTCAPHSPPQAEAIPCIRTPAPAQWSSHAASSRQVREQGDMGDGGSSAMGSRGRRCWSLDHRRGEEAQRCCTHPDRNQEQTTHARKAGRKEKEQARSGHVQAGKGRPDPRPRWMGPVLLAAVLVVVVRRRPDAAHQPWPETARTGARAGGSLGRQPEAQGAAPAPETRGSWPGLCCAAPPVAVDAGIGDWVAADLAPVRGGGGGDASRRRWERRRRREQHHRRIWLDWGGGTRAMREGLGFGFGF